MITALRKTTALAGAGVLAGAALIAPVASQASTSARTVPDAATAPAVAVTSLKVCRAVVPVAKIQSVTGSSADVNQEVLCKPGSFNLVGGYSGGYTYRAAVNALDDYEGSAGLATLPTKSGGGKCWTAVRGIGGPDFDCQRSKKTWIYKAKFGSTTYWGALRNLSGPKLVVTAQARSKKAAKKLMKIQAQRAQSLG
jgi:hypothetical protein